MQSKQSCWWEVYQMQCKRYSYKKLQIYHDLYEMYSCKMTKETKEKLWSLLTESDVDSCFGIMRAVTRNEAFFWEQKEKNERKHKNIQ